MNIRPVGIVLEPEEVHEASGLTLHRAIGGERMALLDPFLLLDHLHVPASDSEAPPVGFPRHPHRGIETLTYVFAGRVHHKDSLGNDDGVGAWESQWMTAGGGIFHEEWLETGPEGCEALQLWFNLPAAQKMVRPAYRAARGGAISEVTLTGGAIARVVAGEIGGAAGPFGGIAVHPTCADARLPAGTTITLPAPQGEAAFAYLYRGTASFGEGDPAREATAPRLIVFGDGDIVQATASHAGEARFLFASAPPLREPVLQYRSLVMNTVDEMRQALDDLENGTFERR
jgi:redox-sensitive bicupin YhaK (pirin superfamily)